MLRCFAGLLSSQLSASAITRSRQLAFFMGLPFPLGLSRVSAQIPELVPWAWGVNGCASVLSAVLAMILAMHLGFSAVVAIAVGLYAISALSFRRSLGTQQQ